jgi:ABC-type uncharacterized transport system permease subunit
VVWAAWVVWAVWVGWICNLIGGRLGLRAEGAFGWLCFFVGQKKKASRVIAGLFFNKNLGLN